MAHSRVPAVDRFECPPKVRMPAMGCLRSTPDHCPASWILRRRRHQRRACSASSASTAGSGPAGSPPLPWASPALLASALPAASGRQRGPRPDVDDTSVERRAIEVSGYRHAVVSVDQVVLVIDLVDVDRRQLVALDHLPIDPRPALAHPPVERKKSGVELARLGV